MATLHISDLERTLEGLRLETPIPHFDSAEVLSKPLDLCRSYLAEIFSSLVNSEPLVAYNSIQLSNDPLHGDFTVVLPKLCPGTKPKEAESLANDLIKKVSCDFSFQSLHYAYLIPQYPENPFFDLPWSDGIYLRICTVPGVLPRILVPYIIDRKDKYGNDPALQSSEISASGESRKKVVIEFSSPNIGKDFQGKHLRSTIMGAFVSHTYASMGWEVQKANYLGDWGKDIALLGVGWEKFGSEEELEKDAVFHLLDVSHRINEQFQPEQLEYKRVRDEAKKNGQDETEATAEIEAKGLYAERNSFFKKMEERDEEAVALFKRIRDINIDNFTKFYDRLGISFDTYSGESKVNQETIAEIEQKLKEKGLLEEIGGASWGVDMKKHGLLKSGMAMVRDRTGGSTYFARHLATIIERSRKQDFDKLVFVAADTDNHYLRLSTILGALDMEDLAKKLKHLQLGEKSHMRERLGAGYQLHGILDQCESAMLDVLRADEEKEKLLGDSEEAAKIVGINALLTQELSTKRTSDHAFDINNMTSFKTGTGPELQYQYAKLCALLKDYPVDDGLANEEYGSLGEDVHTSLLLTLGQYPESTRSNFEQLEPAHIIAYLHTVLEKLSDCLDDGDDDDEDNDGEAGPAGEGEEGGGPSPKETSITPAEAALYEATRIVLENGMKLLGLVPIAPIQQKRVDTPVAE
jgi:arginyl-tRNA synthetase